MAKRNGRPEIRPRIVTDAQLAAYLGKSVSWLASNRLKLEQQGMPRRLPVVGGNDLNAVDNNGNTAMHGASFKQVPSVVSFLASQRSDIRIWNQKNKQGWTPLRIAAGVFRGGMFRFHVPTADRIREVMLSAGVSPAPDDETPPDPVSTSR